MGAAPSRIWEMSTYTFGNDQPAVERLWLVASAYDRLMSASIPCRLLSTSKQLLASFWGEVIIANVRWSTVLIAEVPYPARTLSI
jgi:hypothetical protein